MNPFSQLKKTHHYPFSYLLSSSLKERFKRTFQIFFGVRDSYMIGVINYLAPVFFIFNFLFLCLLQISKLIDSKRKLKTIFSIILQIVSIFIFFALTISIFSIFTPKAAIAALFTLALSPLILLAHGFCSYFIALLNKDIEKLSVLEGVEDTKTKEITVDPATSKTMANYLKGKSTAEIEQLVADGLIKVNNKDYIRISVKGPTPDKNQLTAVIAVNASPVNAAGIDALMKTNKFALTEEAEKRYFYSTLQLLTSPSA